MRIRKRMMKMASSTFIFDELNDEQKSKVIYAVKDAVLPELKKWAQEIIDDETKNKGYSVEIDFDFNYEYVAEEDGEEYKINLSTSKVKALEINDSVRFWNKFKFDRIMSRLADEYAQQDKEYPPYVDVEELIKDIDLEFSLEEFEYSSDGFIDELKISCFIPDSYQFELFSDSEYKEEGIKSQLSKFLKARIASRIEGCIWNDLMDLLEIENRSLYDYSPLNIFKNHLSNISLKFEDDNPHGNLSSETISAFKSFKVKS